MAGLLELIVRHSSGELFDAVMRVIFIHDNAAIEDEGWIRDAIIAGGDLPRVCKQLALAQRAWRETHGPITITPIRSDCGRVILLKYTTRAFDQAGKPRETTRSGLAYQSSIFYFRPPSCMSITSDPRRALEAGIVYGAILDALRQSPDMELRFISYTTDQLWDCLKGALRNDAGDGVPDPCGELLSVDVKPHIDARRSARTTAPSPAAVRKSFMDMVKSTGLRLLPASRKRNRTHTANECTRGSYTVGFPRFAYIPLVQFVEGEGCGREFLHRMPVWTVDVYSIGSDAAGGGISGLQARMTAAALYQRPEPDYHPDFRAVAVPSLVDFQSKDDAEAFDAYTLVYEELASRYTVRLANVLKWMGLITHRFQNAAHF